MRSGTDLDLNGDNLRICTAYLRISDHFRVMVRVRVRFRAVNCCIQSAGEGEENADQSRD